MKKYGRIDNNQDDVVMEFRRLGAKVYIASSLGNGFPDLVVGYQATTILVEVKAAKGKLTPTQERFHKSWRGSLHIIRNKDEVEDLLKLYEASGG